jgi:transformation/transcription domain-associated protein
MIDTMQSVEVEKRLAAHMSTIKRLVFSRSLRLLPLPEQVGVFDALAFLIYQIPGLVPLSDQHLLAFLSEFLKMSSIADGEMSDSSMSGYSVDKNGFVVSAQEPESVPAASQLSSHTCSIFLRRECAVKSPSDGLYVSIPEELANGIQLRVSGLRLFRAVIRQHADAFFDADSTTPVGKWMHSILSLIQCRSCHVLTNYLASRKHPATCHKSSLPIPHFCSSGSRHRCLFDTP